MDKVWQEILQLALNELIQRSNAPVAGAKLRSAVAQIARDRGLEFPPTGLRKFSDLVEAFPADFIIQRHPGSDILVVPAVRAELLAAESPRNASSTARIRQDLFDALTLVPRPDSYGLPYYDPDRDAVLYVKAGGEVPGTAVALPATSLEAEIQLRQRFIAETELHDAAKDALASSLATSTPLRGFGSTIQEFGLIKRWHTFRVAFLATQLREWSVQKALNWQSSWIDTNEPRPTASMSAIHTIHDEKRQISDLAAMLTVEDLSRITVPLDIVLRLLANK